MTTISDKSIGFATEGGSQTARTRATPADVATRAADESDALAYLTRKGLADGSDSVAAVLGLIAAPQRAKEPSNTSARPCAECGTDFFPSSGHQITCSRSCGGKHAHARRRAFAKAAKTTGGTP